MAYNQLNQHEKPSGKWIFNPAYQNGKYLYSTTEKKYLALLMRVADFEAAEMEPAQVVELANENEQLHRIVAELRQEKKELEAALHRAYADY